MLPYGVATLTTVSGRDRALASERTILLPVTTDTGAQTLATARSYGPFAAGDQVVIVANGEFHAVAGVEATAATASSPGPFPAGAYSFTIPDACTHVSLIQGAAGAASGCAYLG